MHEARPAIVTRYTVQTYADARRTAAIRAAFGAAFGVVLICVPSPLRSAWTSSHGASASSDMTTAHVVRMRDRSWFARLDPVASPSPTATPTATETSA